MRRVLTRAWAAAMAIAACTPVDSARSPIAPQNTCPEHPCSIYAPYQAGLDSSCTSGVCSVDARFDYTVVVSVPETSFFAPNTTFAISRADLFSRSNIPVCSLSGAVPCVRLPPIAIAQGDYLVQPAVAVDAKFYLGGVNTVLPAHVTYRTLWTASGAGSPTDALAQGLSILPMMGGLVDECFSLMIVALLSRGLKSPKDTHCA